MSKHAMAKVKFTAGRIGDFKCEEGKDQTFFWDLIEPGLGLRVTAKGAKAYIFQSKLYGKTIRLTIGDPKTWQIDAPKDGQSKGARQEANRLQHLINEGKDPRQIKIERIAKAEIDQRDSRKKSVTLGDAWPVYIDNRRQKWGTRSLADHENIVSGTGTPAALHALLRVKLVELTPERVSMWLKEEAERRPTQAALAFRLLRAFLNWCQFEKDYMGIANPAACGKKGREYLPKKQAKTDCLQREQLASWFREVRNIGNPIISAYLQCLLLTGARPGELIELTWDCTDFQWNGLTIRDKYEGERIIPLTPYVSQLLAALPRRNEWVFSSLLSESGRLQEARLKHNEAVAAADLPPLTLNGLRRSFGTQCEWIEMPAGISAQIMGHKPSATAERHYRQRPLDLLRMWHTKIETWFLEQAGINPDLIQVPSKLRK